MSRMNPRRTMHRLPVTIYNLVIKTIRRCVRKNRQNMIWNAHNSDQPLRSLTDADCRELLVRIARPMAPLTEARWLVDVWTAECISQELEDASERRKVEQKKQDDLNAQNGTGKRRRQDAREEIILEEVNKRLKPMREAKRHCMRLAIEQQVRKEFDKRELTCCNVVHSNYQALTHHRRTSCELLPKLTQCNNCYCLHGFASSVIRAHQLCCNKDYRHFQACALCRSSSGSMPLNVYFESDLALAKHYQREHPSLRRTKTLLEMEHQCGKCTRKMKMTDAILHVSQCRKKAQWVQDRSYVCGVCQVWDGTDGSKKNAFRFKTQLGLQFHQNKGCTTR